MNEQYIKEHYGWEDLIAIVSKLRDKDGCPWDKQQTHESMEKCLCDECGEVIDAVKRKDYLNLREELGDVLLQVLLHANIAEENNEFTLEDVLDELGHKLVRRHPHVFGKEEHLEDANEGLSRWNEMKRKEKLERLSEYEEWVKRGKIDVSALEYYRNELIKKGILDKNADFS